MANAADEKIAIVGGGITGLLCALILAEQKKSVFLFEASGRLGGRIRTIRLDKNSQALTKDWQPSELEFYAEFGPMRVELDKQLLLKALLTRLDIKPKPMGEPTEANKAYLVDFPAYASPTSVHDPKYELRPEEVDKTPLQLLRFALLRIVVHLEVAGESDFTSKKEKLVEAIKLAAAVQEPVDPIFSQWMKDLDEDDYWDIQTRGSLDGVPLYALGFWNLLSDHLSHNAITKLRDLGTFYHLLPENPNAAEWFVWWLLGFAISEQLQGVFGGMECIVDKLVDQIKKDVDEKRLLTNCWVTALERKGSKLKLVFHADHSPASVDDADREYDRVILALPRRPLEKLASRSESVFASEPEIGKLLDSAFGFPMVKTFLVVKKRWWEEENIANRFATRVPTRELHYWKGRTKDSHQGMIMLYTDRPGSSFWANYVPPGEQTDANRSVENPLPDDIRKRLTKKVVQYINENNVPDITPEDIAWYGIRDWAREPFGGANHAWRPERLYWVVMRRLADIAPNDNASGKPSIHVCGEAYSDYHGFMEGSLRSAVYVVHRILDKEAGGTFKRLPWLHKEGTVDPGAALRVEARYLEALCKWAERLDAIAPTAEYLYR
ncbi:MAG: FAD-dependent oxidoreductase [Isosphaeraceae bacterium]|nr:FAD-dependent oxidoreductase [Isosphaeraceae bacterium]